MSDYVKQKRKYKKFCWAKPKQYYVNFASNLEAVQDSKTFWSVINKFKRRSPMVINVIDCNKHFQKLLAPPLLSDPILYLEPYILDRVLDTDFSLEE